MRMHFKENYEAELVVGRSPGQVTSASGQDALIGRG